MMPAMRPVIIAANWKMHTVPVEAAELAATIARRTDVADVIRIICPPFVALAAVRDALAGTGVAVGAQNVHHERTGAFTGEVSAPMLDGLVTWVLAGHSERRRDACETDQIINGKIRRAKEVGLAVILCVGEQLAEREAGRAEVVVRTQLTGALAGVAPPVDDASKPTLAIAYEPVWAIGTGRNASGADAAAMADVIRETLGAVGFAAHGELTPVLYGGSVTAANIGEFLTEPAIDGALVGGASLKPDDMAGIVARAGVTARARAVHVS
jgi:triosephosphate isomerase